MPPAPPQVEIIHGDCRQVLSECDDDQFNLTFADPPFNIGRQYREYVDKRSDYDQFTREWIDLAKRITGGVLCLHGGDAQAELYLSIMRDNPRHLEKDSMDQLALPIWTM